MAKSGFNLGPNPSLAQYRTIFVRSFNHPQPCCQLALVSLRTDDTSLSRPYVCTNPGVLGKSPGSQYTKPSSCWWLVLCVCADMLSGGWTWHRSAACSSAGVRAAVTQSEIWLQKHVKLNTIMITCQASQNIILYSDRLKAGSLTGTSAGELWNVCRVLAHQQKY